MVALGYQTSDSVLEEQIKSELRRNYDPSGVSRQGAAALAAGHRRNEDKLIKVPTLIIHGEDDPLVPVEAGRDLAATISQSKLIIVPGMGHDIPLKLIPQFVESIMKNTNAAK